MSSIFVFVQVESKLQDLENHYREGWTNTSAGLYFARKYLFTKDGIHDRPDVNDIILLFTDGKSNKAIPGSDAMTEGQLNHAAGESDLFALSSEKLASQ